MRGQLKANRIFIVVSSEEKGQPGTKLRVYSFVFVKSYSYISFTFYTHILSLSWLDFNNI